MSAIYRFENSAELIKGKYMEFLSHWPVPYELLKVPTSQGETAIIVSGQEHKPPLILLHGSMSNSIMWRKDVASWSRQFRVYAVDLIGEPGLSAPSRPDLNSDAYAKWLDDIVTRLSLVRPALVGISLGAYMALDYAIRTPGIVSKLVVMCPAGIGHQRKDFYLKAMLLLMLGKWGRRKLQSMVIGTSRSEYQSEGFSAYLNYLSLVRKHFRPRIANFMIFSDDMLQSLKMPVLAIVGGRDVLFDSGETRDRLQQLVPDVRVKYDSELGHMITGQSEEILEFLLGAVNNHPVGTVAPDKAPI